MCVQYFDNISGMVSPFELEDVSNARAMSRLQNQCISSINTLFVKIWQAEYRINNGDATLMIAKFCLGGFTYNVLIDQIHWFRRVDIALAFDTFSSSNGETIPEILSKY